MKNAPNRDTIILWSALIARIGLIALLVRHTAIYKFGTDTFTGNILFGVIFTLLVGLYLGLHSVIEDFTRLISNFFRRKESVGIAETSSGEQVAISVNAIDQSIMSDSTIDRLIKSLKTKGIIERKGQKNNSQWIVK